MKGKLGAGWANGLPFWVPQLDELPRMGFCSSGAHTSGRPRLKEIGPQKGSGVLPPFLQGFPGQMCIRTLRGGACAAGENFGERLNDGICGRPREWLQL